MADRRDCVSSVEFPVFSVESLNPDAFRLYKVNSDLTFDGRRLKWNNNFDELKNFFKNIVGLNGKWTSPGGNSKKFITSRSDLIVTWYYGKQRTLLLQGKEGHLLKDFLITVCETDAVSMCPIEVQSSLGQSDAEAEMVSATTVAVSKCPIEVQSSPGQSYVEEETVGATTAFANITNISKSDDLMSGLPISTLKELEDFIDNSFDVSVLSRAAQPTDISTPTQQRADDISIKFEAQFFTFKGKVELQIENLSTKLSEQNIIIDTSKQELCRLSGENLNLKSRISELEGKVFSMNKFNGNRCESLHGGEVKENPISIVTDDNSIISPGFPPFSAGSSSSISPTVILQENIEHQQNEHQHSDMKVGNPQDQLTQISIQPLSFNTSTESATPTGINIDQHINFKPTQHQAKQDKQHREIFCNESGKATQKSSLHCRSSSQLTEWLGYLPLIEIPNQANQITPCNTKSGSSSALKNHDIKHYKGRQTNTKPLIAPRHNYSRNSPGRRPFSKRWSIKPPPPPSYRTSHRHFSLEWLIHLDAVYCMTRQ